MPHAESIKFTFAAFGKTADALVLPVGNKHIPAAGEDFMPVSLVAYIPYQLIVGGIKNIVQRNGKLHHTEACAKMPTMNAHHIHDVLAQFFTNLQQLILTQFLKVVGMIDLLQQRTGGNVHDTALSGAKITI